MSPSVSTLVASRTPRPRNATAVESSDSAAADPHNSTMPANVVSTIFSLRLSGPSVARARRAAAGASGVAFGSGPINHARNGGMRIIAISVGTDAATSHDANEISTPDARAISAPIGLAAIAVSHNADDRLRLTMPENIRKLPRRRRL